MANEIPVKTLGSYSLSHDDLAAQIKRMLDDIIDVAYRQTTDPKMLTQFKRFSIFCTEEQTKSKLGDCWHNKDGSASIRLMWLGRQRYQDSLITAIHEVSHHVEKSLHGRSGHGPEFYRIHKLLLYAAFDMGILTVDDVIHSESNARNRDKLARMMNDYVPHPVDYKKDVVHIFVYNAADKKAPLTVRGYGWNKLDTAWTKEIPKYDIEKEKQYLLSLGIKESDVMCTEGGAVVTRLRKTAKLYNVPYQYNKLIENFFGYRRVDTGAQRYWQKQLKGDSLSPKEYSELEKLIKGIRIVID